MPRLQPDLRPPKALSTRLGEPLRRSGFQVQDTTIANASGLGLAAEIACTENATLQGVEAGQQIKKLAMGPAGIVVAGGVVELSEEGQHENSPPETNTQ